MKKDITKIFAFVALILLFLSVIFEALIEQNAVSIQPSIIDNSLLLMIIGVAFLYAGNKTVNQIGHGIVAIFALSALVELLTNPVSISSITEILTLVTMALLVLSSIYYVISISLQYFGYTKMSFFTSNTQSSKSSNLKQWKKLVDNQLIDESSYDKVKELVLNNDAKVKDLNEVRDLIAQGLANKSDLEYVLK